MQTSLDTQDLWRARYRDCSAEPSTDLDMDRALFIRSVHAGHGPECRQYLAAAAYCLDHGDEH
ncbi:hypothetical protein IU427_03905 [Nocardia beijingensis]|uniref:Uncharacterized protein n=1 Tax=Nocardia sputorum TaxID=2984338 RepID=A0ABN6TZR7_9NOCA|nr:hypothetical protein [Nocardia beijingensis]MBF6464326.1 hypothetical protein [Nocardia beijingensis]BDT96694.1 hypothetical protein IFM12275_66700 [Nocardia sputorum]BDT98443.1 hypothetical protein IFM12276_14720 [Nocardia sputorum]